MARKKKSDDAGAAADATSTSSSTRRPRKAKPAESATPAARQRAINDQLGEILESGGIIVIATVVDGQRTSHVIAVGDHDEAELSQLRVTAQDGLNLHAIDARI